MVHLIDIPRDTRAPARARRAIVDFDGELSEERLGDAQLLASELVTNSVRYGDGPTVRLLVDTSGGRLRCEIVDDGPAFAVAPRTRPVTAVGGWGLPLVAALADRWGVHDGGPRVWFEVFVP